MRKISRLSLVLLLFCSGLALADHPEPKTVDPVEGLRRLMAGNEIWQKANRPGNSHTTAAYAKENSRTQHPFGAVLSCMDSRGGCIENIFHQGVGDLFSMRVGGNVVSRNEAASLEYAVLHGTRLVTVMGHTRCGAIDAACRQALAKARGQVPPPLTPNLVELLSRISTIPVTADTPLSKCQEESIIVNIHAQMTSLLAISPAIAARVRSGEVHLVGMVYDVDTLAVRVVPPPASVRALLADRSRPGFSPVHACRSGGGCIGAR